MVIKPILKAKPFLKWAGGKTQLLDDLSSRLPDQIIKSHIIENYVEPFIGGGSMFFYLKRYYLLKESYISDINKGLIIGYKTIQSKPNELIEILKNMKQEYSNVIDKESYYYTIRDTYNKINKEIAEIDINNYSIDNKMINHAAQLIFLNRTCYNGIFRQNSDGDFNVPFGTNRNPKICDEKNILEVNKALESTNIIFCDFDKCRDFISLDTFVYLDPPYLPLNITSRFTKYTKEDFNENDQVRLAEFFKEMHLKGAYLMLSNSNPKNKENVYSDVDFFEKYYAPFKNNFHRVYANRMLNCDADKRGKISELIITSYSKSIHKDQEINKYGQLA